MKFFPLLCIFIHFMFIYNNKDETCENIIQKKNYLKKVKTISLTYNYKINGFSITNTQALILIGLLETFKPNNICEFGAGESTKIFETYSKKYNKKFLNIEQNIDYIYKSSIYFPIKHNASLVYDGISYEKNGIYDGLEEFFKNLKSKFDFVFIDGPYIDIKKYEYEYNRIQMIDFIEYDLLDDKGFFLVHDTARRADHRSINVLLLLFRKKYKLKIDYSNKGLPKELTIIKFKKRKQIQLKKG